MKCTLALNAEARKPKQSSGSGFVLLLPGMALKFNSNSAHTLPLPDQLLKRCEFNMFLGFVDYSPNHHIKSHYSCLTGVHNRGSVQAGLELN